MATSTKTAQKVNQTTGDAARSLSDKLEQAADEMAAMSKELNGDSAERLRKSSVELAEAARELGRDNADRARESAEHLVDLGHRKTKEAIRNAEGRVDDLSEMVRAHPATSLGIAAGAGFLVGLLLSRR